MQTITLLKDAAGLLKLRLSFAVGAASTAGFVLASGEADIHAVIVFLCIFTLSAGAACLNNCQDHQQDALMERTKTRPLPAGRIKLLPALIFAWTLLLVGGIGLLVARFSYSAVFTAVLSVLLYNGIYTPLKSRTAMALLPGVICGSLAPLIGWLAAGASITDPAVWSLMIIFGLWQPPHFWLVVIANSGDYLKGELPSMLRVFSRLQLSRILFIWIAMLGISILSLPLALGMTSPALYLLEVVNVTILMALFGLRLLKQSGYGVLFAVLNICVFAGVLLVAVERLWGLM